MTEGDDTEMTPEKAARVARLLFIMAPISFPFLWLLAAVQGGDTRTCLVISVVGTLMCLGTGLLFKLRGAAAPGDAQWIYALLRLLSGIRR